MGVRMCMGGEFVKKHDMRLSFMSMFVAGVYMCVYMCVYKDLYVCISVCMCLSVCMCVNVNV